MQGRVYIFVSHCVWIYASSTKNDTVVTQNEHRATQLYCVKPSFVLKKRWEKGIGAIFKVAELHWKPEWVASIISNVDIILGLIRARKIPVTTSRLHVWLKGQFLSCLFFSKCILLGIKLPTYLPTIMYNLNHIHRIPPTATHQKHRSSKIHRAKVTEILTNCYVSEAFLKNIKQSSKHLRHLLYHKMKSKPRSLY